MRIETVSLYVAPVYTLNRSPSATLTSKLNSLPISLLGGEYCEKHHLRGNSQPLQNPSLWYLYHMARKKTYTIREAAKKLGITPESILKAIQKGRLKARKKFVKIPQKIWMIDVLSVEAYVVSKSHQSRGSKRR